MQFGFAINDRKVNWLWRFAFDNDAIKSREFQFRREETACLRVANRPAHRGLGTYIDPALARNRRPRDHAGHESQHIFGRQRIYAGRHIAQDVIQPHGAAAHILAIKSLWRLLDFEAAAGQVNMQDLASVSVRHSNLHSRV